MNERRRLAVAFTASLAAHAALAALIAFVSMDKPLVKKRPPRIMDVVLLDPEKRLREAPKDARAIANRNAIGGSRKAQDSVTRAARAPVVGQSPARRRPAPPAAPKAPPPAPAPQPSPRTLTKRGPQPNKRKPNTKPHPKTRPAPQVPLSNLMPSTMALAQLSRDFERERRMKQMLSREADVPINTREARFAPYARTLVRTLEEQWRPGQAHYERYTAEARRALLKLTIERNGDLGGVEILRPSPIPQINESAIRAIHAAAPFKPLPSSWGLDRVSFYLTFEIIEDRFVFRTM
ncbi:MAG: TonB family protein [Mariprofundaceae bacterium]